MGVQAPVGGTFSISGVFDRSERAESALDELRSAGVAPDEISVKMREARSGESWGSGDANPVAGSAAAGAVLGGMLGVLVGWVISVTPTSLPGAGTIPSLGTLATTLTALGLGAAVGGLIGALTATGAHPERQEPHEEPARQLMVTVRASPALDAIAEAILRANGASELHAESEDVFAPDYEHASVSDGATIFNEETTHMDDQQSGQDPNAVTGTQGSIDPETGTFGTAGTPMTTGHGVSGSTIGTGNTSDPNEYEEGGFTGATPDSAAYDTGGRGSHDAASTGGRNAPVTEKFGDIGQEDAAEVRSAGRTDVYEGGPAYRGTTGADAPVSSRDYESGASVQESPTYGKMPKDESQASTGSNIEGTADPRGLGDNTDDQG